MRRRFLILSACLFFTGLAAQAQDAAVSGRVSDARGAALSGVSVFVPGTLAATFTAEDGAYRLEDVPVGAVEIRFSLAGYRTHTAQAALADGETATLDVTLTRRPFWERALLFSTDPDADAQATFSIERTLDADALPARTVGEAAGLLPGVVRDARVDSLSFLGGARVARTLDGVPLPAPLPLPWPGVRRLTLYGEHTPAVFAGGRDALLDVTTRDGRSDRLFEVEGLTSALSAAGLTELRGALGGPLPGNVAHVFVAGSIARQDDFAASAVPVWRVKDDVRARLLASPQDLIVAREGDPEDVRVFALPAGLPEMISYDHLAAQVGVPDGYEFVDLRNATSGLTEADFERSRTRRNAEAETRSLLVRAGASLARFDLDVTYADAFDARDVWNLSQALFRDDAFGRTETRQRYLRGDVARAFGPFALRFTASTYRDRATTFDPRFSDDIRNTLDYGDLSDPANATAAAYRIARGVDADGNFVSLGNSNAVDTVLAQRYTDGVLPPQTGVARVFSLPGAAGTDYVHQEMDATFLRLEQTADVRGHAFTLGVEQQQRVQRRITLASPERLAGIALSYADPAYRNLLLMHVGSVYYGYDYLGLDRVDDEDFDAFDAWEPCDEPGEADACRDARRIAPLEVTRTGLYAADRFALGPLRLDLGLRYDLFRHNRRSLYDPYALVPIVRARDLPGVPEGIAPDFAVLYNAGNVIGYRSRDGRFFDHAGQPVTEADLPRVITVRAAPGATFRLEEQVLEDAPARGVLQPRAALNLAVAPEASVWLSYDRTTDLPDDALLNATLQRYNSLGMYGFLPNAALRPEVATTYALGGRIEYGRARLGLSLSQRQIDHVALPIARKNVFPGNYNTFDSDGSVRVRSMSAVLSVERMHGLSLDASYTLSQSRGEVVETSLRPIFWLREANPFVFDVEGEATRHVLSGVLDYRTEAGEGPRVAGMHLFERTHVVLALEAQSGGPYSALQAPYPITMTPRLTGLAGPINGESLPWTTLVHLQAERGFAVRGHVVTLFAQVRNLLDAENLRRVYPATGKPDDDGYLDTDDGLSEYRVGSNDRTYYEMRVLDPNHYGLPREVRLGLRLAL